MADGLIPLKIFHTHNKVFLFLKYLVIFVPMEEEKPTTLTDVVEKNKIKDTSKGNGFLH